MIEEHKWMFKWYDIENEYGKQIVYEPEVFAIAFADNSYQQQIRELLETDRYDVFIDVGAAWGHFSIIASAYCKRVIAFEPQPMRFGFLLYNCRHLFNVDCHYEFVACEGTEPTMGTIEEMCEVRHRKRYNVKVISLDDLDIKPDERVLIKLDVEGSELKVLADSKKLIANPNVDWVVDVHKLHGVKDQDILEIFKHKNSRCHGSDALCSAYEFIGTKK